MIHYETNTGTVLDTLKKYHYQQNVIQQSEKCYSVLRSVCGDEHDFFSKEKALLWSDSLASDRARAFYSITIHRLADVYEYGHVLAAHLRIHAILDTKLQAVVDIYTSSLNYCCGYNRALHATCIHFCEFLQCNGVLSVEEISYQILDFYCEFIGQSDEAYRGYIMKVGHFLRYLVANGHLRPAFAMYMNVRFSSKCITLGDLSPKCQEIVKESNCQEGYISAEDLYRSIEHFSAQLVPFGYSDNVISYMSFYLKLLYIFLDREKLGYSRTTANAWLEGMCSKVLATNRTRAVNRTLDLYDDYVETGNILPLQRLRHLESAYERLPSWCRESVDQFLESKGKEKRAVGTIRQLKSQISFFCEFLVQERLSSFNELTPEIVKKFNIERSNVKPRTRNNYNGGAKLFLIFLELKGMVKSGLHFALSSCYAEGERIVSVLNQSDREHIYAYCRAASSPIELRDAAILLLGMNTALRACDILALKYADINWTERTICIVQRKTGVGHKHSVDVETLNAIFRYIRDARPKNALSDTIFISTRVPYMSLTSSVCNDALKRSGSSVSDFHRLRRTYATDSIAGGATLKEAAELLGQSDTNSLNRYASLDIDRMRLCPLSLEETGLLVERGRY